MDIQALRNMRNSDFSKITSEFQKIANPEYSDRNDDRYWKLEGDKAGNGTATIRFLPRVEGDELPWVRIFSHGFKGPTGKWYIENSLSTFNEADPVGELNSQLWNSGSEANKKTAQAQKRRLSYIANILVVSDPKHPENEGKVFLFKFGKKIFDKLMDKAQPAYEDEKPVNVFDLWEGANFKLRMRKKDGYVNYDESTFNEPASITDDDNKLLDIVNSRHKLSELLDRKNFKTYDQLKKKLEDVLSAEAYTPKSAAAIAEVEDRPVAEARQERTVQAAPVQQAKTVSKSTPVVEDDDDDVMSYFSQLADSE